MTVSLIEKPRQSGAFLTLRLVVAVTVNQVNRVSLRPQLVRLTIEAHPPVKVAASVPVLTHLVATVFPGLRVVDSLRNVNDLDGHGLSFRCGLAHAISVTHLTRNFGEIKKLFSSAQSTSPSR